MYYQNFQHNDAVRPKWKIQRALGGEDAEVVDAEGARAGEEVEPHPGVPLQRLEIGRRPRRRSVPVGMVRLICEVDAT